jgi:hypothetical protein
VCFFLRGMVLVRTLDLVVVLRLANTKSKLLHDLQNR